MNKIKISPSLLACDIMNMEREIKDIEGYADMLHIDVMDGVFVPNINFGPNIVKGLKAITNTILDVHLMICDPIKYIKAFAEAGSDIITIHSEIKGNIGECLDLIKSYGIKASLALNPDTNPEVIRPYLNKIDMVLQMTVFPGFGGQGMVESALSNISVLREMIGDMDLEVDGGIYSKNVEIIKEKGANVIVSGTGVFKEANRKKAIEILRGVKNE